MISWKPLEIEALFQRTTNRRWPKEKSNGHVTDDVTSAVRHYDTIRYDTIGEFNVDWKAEYSALSSTRSQKKKLKQPTPVPL